MQRLAAEQVPTGAREERNNEGKSATLSRRCSSLHWLCSYQTPPSNRSKDAHTHTQTASNPEHRDWSQAHRWQLMMDPGLCVFNSPPPAPPLSLVYLPRADNLPAARISQENITSQHVEVGESHNQYLSRQVMKLKLTWKLMKAKTRFPRNSCVYMQIIHSW